MRRFSFHCDFCATRTGCAKGETHAAQRGACCSRSDYRATMNEVTCKVEGFILRQVQRAVIRSADESLFSVLCSGGGKLTTRADQGAPLIRATIYDCCLGKE